MCVVLCLEVGSAGPSSVVCRLGVSSSGRFPEGCVVKVSWLEGRRLVGREAIKLYLISTGRRLTLPTSMPIDRSLVRLEAPLSQSVAWPGKATPIQTPRRDCGATGLQNNSATLGVVPYRNLVLTLVWRQGEEISEL